MIQQVQETAASLTQISAVVLEKEINEHQLPLLLKGLAQLWVHLQSPRTLGWQTANDTNKDQTNPVTIRMSSRIKKGVRRQQ